MTATVALSIAKGVAAQTRESNGAQVPTQNASTAPAKSDDSEHRTATGCVIAMDGPDVVIDLGSTQGLRTGDLVEIWRPVKVRHPVTGKIISDRFLTGDLTLRQVRGNLSWARPAGALERPVAVGDIVQRTIVTDNSKAAAMPSVATLQVGAAPSASATQTSGGAPTESNPGAPADNDALQVAKLFESMQGRSPIERAAQYEHYVKHHRTRFARTLLEEAALLRVQAAGVDEAVAETGVVHLATIPDVVRPNRPLVIGLWMPGRHAGAVLQVRNANEPSYTPLPMRQTSADYYEAIVPVDFMKPGTIAICIERVEPDGKAYPLVGTMSVPRYVVVRSEPEALDSTIHHGLVRLVTDYADWNRGRGNDYAWQTEGDVGIRLQDKGIRAVRSGFGVYRGKGGSLSELDVFNVAPRSVGLTYGYLEGEFGFSSFASLIGRAAVGLGEDGVTGGGQAFVRLGNDQATNLMLGGEVLGGIGLRGIAQLELMQFERFPILLRSEVTNQPVGVKSYDDVAPFVHDASNVGVRVIGQLGYRVMPALTLALRGSYQGRTINHAGPGGGAAVIYAF